MEIKAHELQKLINICYEAVDKSSVGPLYLRKEDGSFVVDPVNNCRVSAHIPAQAFFNLLNCLAPKSFNMNIEGMEDSNETKK